MMRKYMIGVLVGFCLSFAVGAHAEVVTMINKVVEGTFPVTVLGNKLAVDAVVIEGSTYLPVRAFGEAIGYTVGFDSDLGVNLSKTVTDATYAEQPTQPAVDPRFQKINELTAQKVVLQKQIEELGPIARQYETVTYDTVNGMHFKEKDALYYETKKTRDEAITKRDAIEQQIKELSK